MVSAQVHILQAINPVWSRLCSKARDENYSTLCCVCVYTLQSLVSQGGPLAATTRRQCDEQRLTSSNGQGQRLLIRECVCIRVVRFLYDLCSYIRTECPSSKVSVFLEEE
jgi:hypothetical protein